MTRIVDCDGTEIREGASVQDTENDDVGEVVRVDDQSSMIQYPFVYVQYPDGEENYPCVEFSPPDLWHCDELQVIK